MSEPGMDGSRVALVTGAAGALGSAIVTALRRQVTCVVAVERTTDEMAALEPDIIRETADVTDAVSVADLFERVMKEQGRVDAVVNTVGAFRPGSAVESTEGEWQMLLDVNLSSAWWVSRAAGRVMQAAGAGSIVHIGARNGVEAQPGAAAYGVTKAALVHLTRILDAELRSSGVRVNAVLPGVIDTPANRAALTAAAMQRAVSPDAIAKVIAFLAGDDGAPVAGAVIPVYGTG